MNKNVFLWSLYDFAMAPLVVSIGGLYLAQWLVLDNNVPEIWYSGVFSLVTLVLLVTAPFFGAWSDRIGRRKPFLFWTTIILLISETLLGITAVSTLSLNIKIVLVLILFFIIQYTYQTGIMFYNALIQSMATKKTVGKISSIGELFYEIGWLLSPLILFLFASGKITFFGEPGRGQVFLPAAIFLAIFGLPMLLWLKEEKSISKPSLGFMSIYKTMIQGLVILSKKNKNILLFLTAFMLVADALLTVTLYFALYIDKLFHVDDLEKIFIIICFEIVAIFSTYLVGIISDKYGTKKILVISCLILFANFIAFALVKHIGFMYVCAAFFGIGFAGFWVTSRALLFKISPTTRQAEYFGFYSIFQKFASIIGPLLWGTVIIIFKKYDVLNYRLAAASLAILAFIGTLLMSRVNTK